MRIKEEYQRFCDLRRATIADIGKISDFTDDQIADLQIHADINRMTAYVNEKTQRMTPETARKALTNYLARRALQPNKNE